GEFRPDVIKRFMLQSRAVDEPGSFGTNLRYLHYYALLAHEEGVLYQIALVRRAGHTRAEVLDTLALATWHSPHHRLHYMAGPVAEALRAYEEAATPFPWPDGWSHDPDALRSGVDFSSPELSAAEFAQIEDWYRRVTGEIPRHVRFLG